MLKEIKYLIFLLLIGFFLFFTAKYYFSDENKKNSFRSLSNIDKKINIYSEKLPVLENDTKDIIQYVEKSNKDKKKKFNFWKLLD
ncbi:hypothetical protein [Candidatus Pelagibacter sp.]|uniref:hypothetical protein n=1 Tax=Candidatus Pelagibacter sp. TaxID=2024849 RepID=UPI003F826F57